jgi:hypothetical protein
MIGKKSNKELRQLWRDFGDNTPIDDDDNIEEAFLDFEAGTNRLDVWHWFDEQYSYGVARLEPDIAIEDTVFDRLGEDSSSWEQEDSHGDTHTVNRDDVMEYIFSADGKTGLLPYKTKNELISKDTFWMDYLKSAAKNMLDKDLQHGPAM